MRTLIPSLICLFLLPVAAVHAEAFDPSRVADDAKWVVHIDADAGKASKVCDAITQSLLQRPVVATGRDNIERFTGIRVPQDVHDVTIFASSFDEADNVVLLHCEFDQKRIQTVLSLNATYKSTKVGSREIMQWFDDGKTHFAAFLDAKHAVIARTSERVTAAMDRIDKKSKGLDMYSPLMTTPGTSAIIYVAGRGLADLAKKGVSPVVAQADSAVMVIGDNRDKGEVFLRGEVTAHTADQAEQMQKAADGIKAIVAMSAGNANADARAKMAAELMTNLKIDRAEKTVKLDLNVPQEKVIKAIEDHYRAATTTSTSPTMAP